MKKEYIFFSILILISFVLKAQTTPKVPDIPDTTGYTKGQSNIPDYSNIPDAVFNATVTGDINQTIEFTLKGNIPGQYLINGNYVSSLQLFRVNISGNPQMLLGFGAIIPEMKAGTYKMNESQLAVGGYTNPQLSKHSYTSTSGSMTVTKAGKHQSYMGTMDWFINGSFEMKLESGSNPDKKITIKGSFTGMGIKAN